MADPALLSTPTNSQNKTPITTIIYLLHNYSMTKFALLLLTTLAAVTLADEDIGLCCLCSGCDAAVNGRANMFVNTQGQTCSELIMEMADPTNSIKRGNGACNSAKLWHYSRCCDSSSNPPVITQTGGGGGNSEANSYPSGNHPKFDLCEGGTYPTAPTTQVAVLNHGAIGTCRDLYHHTNRGMFEARMCRPIRNFFKEHCCPHTTDGENNGGGNGGNAGNGGDDNSGKNNVFEDSKDDTKLYEEGGDTKRGGIDRRRGLRTSTTKHR